MPKSIFKRIIKFLRLIVYQQFSMAQFSALFTKNWILFKRNLFANLLEIVLPILFVAFLQIIRKLSVTVINNEQSFLNNSTYSFTWNGNLTENSHKLFDMQCLNESAIALIPPTNPLIEQIKKNLQANQQKTVYFSDEGEFESYIRSINYPSSRGLICSAIVVTGMSPNYSYKIRANLSTGQHNENQPHPLLQLTLDQAMYLYTFQNSNTNSMIPTATFVNSLIMQSETKNNESFFKHFTAPIHEGDYVVDFIYSSIGETIGIIMILPLLLIYLRQTSTMLAEKESKIRQTMSIMGMKMSYYYLTWFLRYFISYLIIHTIASIIFTVIFPFVPFYLPFLVCLLFDVVLIIQNFFIQIFFTRARIGVLISLLFFVLQFSVAFISTGSSTPSEQINNGISAIPHVAFILAFQSMLYAEAVKIPITFQNTLNYYTIQTTLISLSLNIIVFTILSWYLDQVIPNQWGAKKHPLFCFIQKEQFSQKKEVPKDLLKSDSKLGDSTNKNFAENYEHANQHQIDFQREQKIIKISSLRKEFVDSEKVAVHNLNIKMYNNEIFALLGHNGAGKTTTISMLTGMLQPTSGEIKVMGETEIEKIRQIMGVCPQHDTLYDDLTVEEHLRLFAGIKEIEAQFQDEIDTLIADVNLESKKDQYSKNLSGGQKRRLSMAIAFTGRSKVIILDEPTSGMDTSARRYIWEMLENYKNNRIIILITHFIEEADYLGDRIGIMGGGRMLCCGSSLYLKNKFGVGYNITFAKNSPQTDSQPIIQLVTSKIPSAQIISNVSSELSMQLPITQTIKFSALFHDIKRLKQKLQIQSYGISVTTLEEVFLKVIQDPDDFDIESFFKKMKLARTKSMNQPSRLFQHLADEKIYRISQNLDLDNLPRVKSQFYRFFLHFKATFLKRFRIVKRDTKSFIFELILPIVIIVFALFLMKISFFGDDGTETINLNTYLIQQNPVVIGLGSTMTSIGNSINSELKGRYQSNIQMQYDTQTKNVKDFDLNYLFPLKKNLPIFKGGIFFENTTSNYHEFSTLVNTRSPTSFLFLQTLAAQSYINSQFSKNITIDVVNQPLPRTYIELLQNNVVSGFLASVIFSLALSFKFASIVAFLVKEREDGSKYQQVASGMKSSSFWIANFIFDYLLYAVIAIVSAGLVSIMQVNLLSSSDALPFTWALFLLYGLAYIPFIYIFSNFFKNYGNAQSVVYFVTFLFGGLIPTLTFVLRFIAQGSNPIGRGLAWVLRINPAYCFGEGLMNMGSRILYRKYENNGVLLEYNSMEIALAPLIYLAVGFPVYFTLIFIVEKLQQNQQFMRYISNEKQILDTTNIIEDDVLAQYERANSANPDDYEIVTKRMRKVYMVDSSKGYQVAVDNLSLALTKGQIFGLVGINGAGKTTTFKMLAAQLTSTSGECYLRGQKISENMSKIRQNIGYCPQFDALVDSLTVREQLEMHYDLKSLSTQFRDQAVTKKIEDMNLMDYENQQSGTLSGGNKRKLSVAIALIGSPPIVFLDEPTTGMDPQSKRILWKILSRIALSKQISTIILTTHSMDEVDALSSRLGIMVNGNFKCIGTPQHIKSKYGKGFEIEMKISSVSRQDAEALLLRKNIQKQAVISNEELDNTLNILDAKAEDKLEINQKGSGRHIFFKLNNGKRICEIFTIIEFLNFNQMTNFIKFQIEKSFGKAQILQSLQSVIRLKTTESTNVADLFKFLEENAKKLTISQYTVKQASVEQIFNKFAKDFEENIIASCLKNQ